MSSCVENLGAPELQVFGRCGIACSRRPELGQARTVVPTLWRFDMYLVPNASERLARAQDFE